MQLYESKPLYIGSQVRTLNPFEKKFSFMLWNQTGIFCERAFFKVAIR